MEIECLLNPHNDVKDVVIITVPWTDSMLPLMAPAALKPIVELAGKTCLAVDLNAEIFRMTKTHPEYTKLLDFFFSEKIDPSIADWLHDLFSSIAHQILSWNPSIVGLSLFSYVCQNAGKWLAYYIKKINPSVKIVVGGAGCLDTFTGPSEYIEVMLRRGLYDYHIRGDGENSFYQFLTGNTEYPGINDSHWKEMTRPELESLPMPDYGDYDFEIYEKKALPLIGSRGCVRKCTFCDYIANWKNFRWRTAEHIFNEMINQYKKYQIRYFKFQDSLTNGNMREFIKLTELLSDYNLRNPNESFSWSGYYIFRDITSSSEREWQLLHNSGAKNLAVGIENLNEHIRYKIGKKFSNSSIDFHLTQAKKYQISLFLLNIVGYIDETRSDIDFIKRWLDDHVEYRDLLTIQWGGTLGIFPNTYLYENMQNLGIIKINKDPQQWINPATGSVPALRASWANELKEYSELLGYRVANNIDNHYMLETLIK